MQFLGGKLSVHYVFVPVILFGKLHCMCSWDVSSFCAYKLCVHIALFYICYNNVNHICGIVCSCIIIRKLHFIDLSLRVCGVTVVMTYKLLPNAPVTSNQI